MDNPGVLKEYKNREHSRTLEFEDIKDGRIKKSLDLLELNVNDGRNPLVTNIGEQSDSYLLRSNLLKLPTSLVGYFWNDECHFIPIENDVLVVDTAKEQIRDKPRATEVRVSEDNQPSSSEKAAGVVVSAQLKPSNNAPFGGKIGGSRRKPVDNDPDILFHNQQKQMPWRTVRYKQFSPESAFENRIPLLYPYEDNEFTDAHVYGTTQKNYTHSLLTQLSPALANQSLTQPAISTSTDELVRSIMLKAQVIRFSKLVTCVQDRSPDPHPVSNASVLHSVQKVAVLVQGWWIVKSDLLYPPGTFSEHSGVHNNLLVRARDYIMAVFYRGEHLTRKTISSMTKLPALEATEILKTLTQRMDMKQRGHINHWLFRSMDQEFVRRHPDIVQQQNTMWEARIRQLCTQLKLERLVSDGTRRKRIRSGRVYSESGSESESMEPLSSLVSGLQVSASATGPSGRHPARRRQLSLSQSPDSGNTSGELDLHSGRQPRAKRARTHSLCLPDTTSNPMSPPPVPPPDTNRVNVQLARDTPTTPMTSPSPDKVGARLVPTELLEPLTPSMASTSAIPDLHFKLEPMSPPCSEPPLASVPTTDGGVAMNTGEEALSKATKNEAYHKELTSGEGKAADKAVSLGLFQFVQDQLRARPLVSLSSLAKLYQQTLSHGENGSAGWSAVLLEGFLEGHTPPPPGSEAERELLKGYLLEVLEQADARKLSVTWPSVPSSLPEEPLFTCRVAGSECGAVCEKTQQLREAILELIETTGSFRMGDLQEQLQKNSVGILPRRSIISVLKHMCIYRHGRYFLRLTISE